MGFRRAATALCLAALAAFVGADGAAAGNPMASVITLLEELMTKVEDEGMKEEANYKEFSAWCAKTSKEYSEKVKEGKAKIEELEASIDSLTSEKAITEAKVAKRQTAMKASMEELSASRAECLKEEAEYQATKADIVKAAGQIEDAIKALKDAKPSFVAETKKLVKRNLEVAYALNIAVPKRDADKKAVAGFLQTAVDPDDPEYKSQTKKIIKVLEDMKKEFEAQEETATSENEDQEESCKDVQDTIAETIGEHRDAIEKGKEKIENLKEKIADAEEELEETKETLADDTAYLAEMTKKCKIAKRDFTQRSTLRKGELEALGAAVKILEEEVKGAYDSTTQLLQRHASRPRAARAHGAGDDLAAKAPISFLQVGDPRAHIESLVSEAKEVTGAAFVSSAAAAAKFEKVRTRVTELLTSGSSKWRSPALSALAVRIEGLSHSGEPKAFEKVKEMIYTLIGRLNREIKDDLSKEWWCKESIGLAKQERDNRYQDCGAISAELDSLESRKADLEEALEKLGKETKELAANLGEALKLREEEKSENMAKLEEAKGGLAALLRAMQVLKDFYMSSKHAKISLAQRAKRQPELGFEPGEAYTGQVDASEKIIGELEEIQIDFEKTISATETQEAESAADFTEFERTTKATMSGKATKTKLNQQDLATAESRIVQGLKNLKRNQKLMDAALKELDELKPACLSVGMTYEERKAQREDEIKLLKMTICLFDHDPEDCM